MVCSNCGHDAPAGSRFCGMCGTPLPQRPITAPAAQSTLSFTRIPVQGPSVPPVRPAESKSPLPTKSPASAGRVLEMPSPDPATVVTKPTADEAPATAREQELVSGKGPRDVVEPSIHGRSQVAPHLEGSELLAQPTSASPGEPETDIPLERFVRDFKYEPPAAPAETNMRGETAMKPKRSAPEPHFTAPPEIGSHVHYNVEDQVTTPPEAAVIAEPAETSAPRSRFLDLNEPATAAPTPPGRSGTTTITGPSFLGLSDPAVVETDYTDEPKPPASHWRLWLALAIVFIFAALGFMEWRAQMAQTHNGPLDVIKMQINRMKRGKGAPSTDTAAPASPDSNSKPDMQVEPQPQQKPAAPDANQPAGNPSQSATEANPNGGGGNSAAPNSASAAVTATTPIGNQPPNGAPAGDSSTVTDTASANAKASGPPNAAPSTKSAASTASSATAKAGKPAASEPDVVKRQFVPGAEEMRRADNASDAAASAAWLWKATGKGNSEAPIRLADMYIKGAGVPKDCDQALVLLKSAAAKGNVRAMQRLGSLYAVGVCVTRDRVQAYQWLNQAVKADPGSDWAAQNRDLMWRQMTPQERAQVQ